MGHEQRSVEFANQTLPDFGFKEKEINEINKLIMSTQLPQNPDGYLSEILCDADLYYLGTKDYFIISERFYQELRNFNKINNEKDWLIMQIDFLERHQYFTKFAKQNLEPIKQINLKLLKEKYENQKFES
jgi:predicted metal-dependent HD superfamily phosphohydrolase